MVAAVLRAYTAAEYFHDGGSTPSDAFEETPYVQNADRSPHLVSWTVRRIGGCSVWTPFTAPAHGRRAGWTERQHQGHQDRVLRSEELLGLRQDLDRRRRDRLGRDAQGRRQGLRGRRARSRRTISLARIRAGWSTTGRPFIAAPSIAAARSRPRFRAASIRRSGTSRARSTACPSISCSADPRAIASASTASSSQGNGVERDQGRAARHHARAVQVQRGAEVRRGGRGALQGAARRK